MPLWREMEEAQTRAAERWSVHGRSLENTRCTWNHMGTQRERGKPRVLLPDGLGLWKERLPRLDNLVLQGHHGLDVVDHGMCKVVRLDRR